MLTLVAWLILLPLAVPALVFATEVTLGLPAGRSRRPTEGAPVRFTVLMPAHDEAATIRATIAPLLASMPETGGLLVVADNCNDATAAIARSLGAGVIERHDPRRRGKGFALAFGRDALARDPPDAVVVLDADCRVEGGGQGAAVLAAAAQAAARPVQARYTFIGDRAQPAMVQVSNFALLVKNRVRQRGLARLGVPVPLTGTGMAFPWALLADAPLATDDLVEDLALGLHFAEGGRGPLYVDSVAVMSAASTEGGTLVQRTRWEHGFLSTARRHGLRLLRVGLVRGSPRLAWIGLHLLTPPLALLVAGLGALSLVEGVLGWAGGSWGAAFVVFLLLAADLILVGIAWTREGREMLAGSALARVPLYIVWKLPVYLGLLRRRETRWVRSERANDPPLH